MQRKAPKLGIYFSHYQCFGHTTRVVAVAEIFKKRFPDGGLFFIQAGREQEGSRIKLWGDVYPLPGVLVDRRRFRQIVSISLPQVHERAVVLKKLMTRQKPDLFITECFPLSREESRYELIPSLVRHAAQGGRLWALAGYPLLTGDPKSWRDKLMGLYQKVIILAPPVEKEYMAASFKGVRERKAYNDFFNEYAERIEYAGYLHSTQAIVEGPECPFPENRDVCRVAVVRGGGAVYSRIIAQAILVSDVLGYDYYFSIVAGPSTTTSEWNLFKRLAARKKIANMELHRAVRNYEEIIRKSDVCVSSAGYHTSLMLLKYQKRAVIVPFEGYGGLCFHEQPARAMMLHDMIGARILGFSSLTTAKLAVEIKKAAVTRNKDVPLPADWFNGGEFLDRSLRGLFGPS